MPKQTLDLHAFLIEELRDLYDAEKQLAKSLPKMAKAASNEELKNAINEHLETTKSHVQRLEQCFEHLQETPRAKACHGVRGILEEGKEVLEEEMEGSVMDAAIAVVGCKIEHYEMAAYESLHTIAGQLDLQEVANLLAETLEEEQDADRLLNEICGRMVEEAASGAEGVRAGGKPKSRAAS
jgi:ferritin-like metal-binding protein YciE